METTLLKFLEFDEGKVINQTDQAQAAGENIEDLQSTYHWLEYLPQFLIKTYVKMHNDEESFAVKDIIKDLFKKVWDFIYHPNPVFAISALKGLNCLLESYFKPYSFKALANNQMKIIDSKKLLDVATEIDVQTQMYWTAVKPLLMQVLSELLPKFPKLMYMILGLDLSILVEFLDIPVYLLKHINDLSLKNGNILEFEGVSGKVDLYIMTDAYLSYLGTQILNEEDIDFIYSLMSPFVRLLSISDSNTNMKTQIQCEASSLVFKVCQHCIKYLEPIQLLQETKVKTNSVDPFADFQIMVYSQLILQVVFCLPLIDEEVYKQKIWMSLLNLWKYMTSSIDRLYVMLSWFDPFVSSSLQKSNFDNESFSFKTLPWFVYLTDWVKGARKASLAIIYEEELFLAAVESLCTTKNQFKLKLDDPSGGTIFDGADYKSQLDPWLKLAFDLAESNLKLLDIQNPEGWDTNSLWLGYLRFLEQIAQALNDLGSDSTMGSFFTYKFETLRDSVVNKTPIVGLAAIKV